VGAEMCDLIVWLRAEGGELLQARSARARMRKSVGKRRVNIVCGAVLLVKADVEFASIPQKMD
jgi:hypothetical protein